MSHSATIYNNDLYIFGGFCGESKLNDLWKFDLVSLKWQKINASGMIPEVIQAKDFVFGDL